MTSDLVRVVLVDDHEIVLEGLVMQIDSCPDLEVVGTATRAEEGQRVILQTRPDIAIFDLELPGRGPFDVIEELLSRQKETRVIILTGHVSDIFVEMALRLKVSSYLLKGEPSQYCIDAIRRVARGEFCFSSEVQEKITFDPGTKRYAMRNDCGLSCLTNRQLEVLRYLVQGLSVKEVAREMHLSEKSIDSHKYRIMHRLGIHDRVELSRFAIREGQALP